MFGYIRARQDKLSESDRNVYQSAYCGLCRALGKRYGFRCRFLVNYDLTFLYLLKASCREAAPTKKCMCPAKMFGKKPCVCDPDGYADIAAANVILSWLKMDDNVKDNGWFKALPYRFLRLFYKRAWRRACADAPEFARIARERLNALSELEKARSDSIDATSDAFACIVSACADDLEEPVQRPAKVLLYQIGRFLYLVDALDDLPDDCKTGSYNPLRFRFSVRDGKLCEEDLRYFSELTDCSVNISGSAFNLIPVKSYQGLLENIIYLGLPSVFTAVKNGTFWSRKKDKPRKEQDT